MKEGCKIKDGSFTPTLVKVKNGRAGPAV